MKSSVLSFAVINTGANGGDLAQSLLETQAHFDNKVALIAPKFYHPNEINPEQWKAFHTKAGKKKRKRDPVLQQQKREAMRAKFDPDAPAFTAPVDTPEQSSTAVVKKRGHHYDPRMAALGKELGFVPGSAATPAELKARLGMVRSFYRGRRNLNSANKKAKSNNNKKNKKRARPDSSAGTAGAEPGPTSAKRTAGAAEKDDGGGDDDDDDQVAFGRFTYQNGAPVPSYQQQKPRKRGISKDVDLLRKAEKRKAEQEALRATEDGRQQLAQQEWEKMNKLAAGGKLVKDDIRILKKKIKSRQKKKAKSQKKWEERTHAVKEDKRSKQARYLEGKQKTVTRKREKRLRRTGFGTKKKHINK